MILSNRRKIINPRNCICSSKQSLVSSANRISGKPQNCMCDAKSFETGKIQKQKCSGLTIVYNHDLVEANYKRSKSNEKPLSQRQIFEQQKFANFDNEYLHVPIKRRKKRRHALSRRFSEKCPYSLRHIEQRKLIQPGQANKLGDLSASDDVPKILFLTDPSKNKKCE